MHLSFVRVELATPRLERLHVVGRRRQRVFRLQQLQADLIDVVAAAITQVVQLLDGGHFDLVQFHLVPFFDHHVVLLGDVPFDVVLGQLVGTHILVLVHFQFEFVQIDFQLGFRLPRLILQDLVVVLGIRLGEGRNGFLMPQDLFVQFFAERSRIQLDQQVPLLRRPNRWGR